MTAPVLNRALALEAPQRTADGAGGYVTTWQTLGTLWAAVQPRASARSADGGLVSTRARVRILVRAAPPGSPRRPVPGQRFRAGARIYVILAVTEAEASGRFLACDADEEIPT